MSHPKLPRLPGLLRGSRVSFAAFVVLLVTLPSICRAYVELSALTPIRDNWVDSGNPTTSHDNDPAPNQELRARSNTKQIYLKFRVEQSFITSKATPTKATLRLYKKAGATATIRVYAAKNTWGSELNWNLKPLAETVELTHENLVTGANDFVVTNYISGPGEYSFLVKSDGTADAVFYSAESATNKPTLTLEVPTVATGKPNDYERLLIDVLNRGQAYRNRYMTFNPTPTSDGNRTGAEDVMTIGYFDVTKFPYSAKGDNSTDDTIAIQRAINEARDAQVAVYFPKNRTFIVSAPIDCVQGLIRYETEKDQRVKPLEDFQSTDWERVNHRDFPCVLMGAALPLNDSRRPELVIDPAATDFDTANPLLRFWSRSTGEVQNTTAEDNYPAACYNHLIRNLDINLSGKDGAIGISMVGTQGTAIESLRINANGALAGIRGLPGAGGCTSAVTINGGRYGIDAFKASGELAGITSVLNNCTIDADDDATTQENSIRWNNYGPIVLVGCSIKGGPIRIEGPSEGSSGDAARGNLSIADSMIWITTSERVAIKGSRAAYLRNVYCKNLTAMADISTAAGTNDPAAVYPTRPVGSPTPWVLVKEYAEGAVIDQDPVHNPNIFPHDPTEPTPRYVNGNAQSVTSVASYDTTFYKDMGVLGGIPTSLIGRHEWPGAIDWDGADVINVKVDHGAYGDNHTDDWGPIHDAIEATVGTGKKVFLPAGQYLLNKRLVLHADTVLFGLHKSYSVLKANDHPLNPAYAGDPDLPFNGGGAENTALVQTDIDQDGNTKLCDLMLLQRKTAVQTFLLNWRVGGEQATVQNVNFERRTVNKEKFGTSGDLPSMGIPLIKISKEGGGRWYSMNHQSSGTVTSSYRNIKIEGSTNPLSPTPTLRFYMFNPEIDSDDIYNAEILNRTNLDVFGSKSEGLASPFVHLAGGKDIRWFGLGGNGRCSAFAVHDEAVFEIDNCPSLIIGSCSYHAIGATGDTAEFNRVKDISGSDPIKYVDGTMGFVSYRRDQNNLVDDTN